MNETHKSKFGCLKHDLQCAGYGVMHRGHTLTILNEISYYRGLGFFEVKFCGIEGSFLVHTNWIYTTD